MPILMPLHFRCDDVTTINDTILYTNSFIRVPSLNIINLKLTYPIFIDSGFINNFNSVTAIHYLILNSVAHLHRYLYLYFLNLFPELYSFKFIRYSKQNLLNSYFYFIIIALCHQLFNPRRYYTICLTILITSLFQCCY